jgi:hypothetical protein
VLFCCVQFLVTGATLFTEGWSDIHGLSHNDHEDRVGHTLLEQVLHGVGLLSQRAPSLLHSTAARLGLVLFSLRPADGLALREGSNGVRRQQASVRSLGGRKDVVEVIVVQSAELDSGLVVSDVLAEQHGVQQHHLHQQLASGGHGDRHKGETLVVEGALDGLVQAQEVARVVDVQAVELVGLQASTTRVARPDMRAGDLGVGAGAEDHALALLLHSVELRYRLEVGSLRLLHHRVGLGVDSLPGVKHVGQHDVEALLQRTHFTTHQRSHNTHQHLLQVLCEIKMRMEMVNTTNFNG